MIIFWGDISKANIHNLLVKWEPSARDCYVSHKWRANNDSTTFRALVGFNHRCWGFRFLSTGALGEFGPVHARPRSLADTSLGENGDHKTGHDAMGPPACFQDGRRTTNVHDGRRTNSITRNICQSRLSIFQN